MNIKRVSAVYFSPTGTTQKTVIAMAEGIDLPFRKFDMTLPAGRRTFKEQFGEEDLVIVGLPVYVGRIPMCLDDLYARLTGHSTQAIAVVVYGNREYNDALIELKMELESRGFIVRSAAVFVGESTATTKIATGRPDAADLAVARDFGKRTIELIRNDVFGRLEVNGSYPFTWPGYDPKIPTDRVLPLLVTSEKCIDCKICSKNCPWTAIVADDSKNRDRSKCMLCYRCVRNCPSQAVEVTGDKWLAYLPEFERMCARRCEPELFFPY
jgi:ferredoxin